jgi:hypothetical protein
MTEYVERKRIESKDGLRAVTLELGDHGLCRFVTWKLYDPAPDIPEFGGLTWTLDKFSGFYASLSEAEAAATDQLFWLKA